LQLSILFLLSSAANYKKKLFVKLLLASDNDTCVRYLESTNSRFSVSQEQGKSLQPAVY